MSQIIADRIKETSTTTGTGAFTLAGAMTGYRAFSAVCSVADTLFYVIEGVNGDGSLTGEWEVGLGTYSGANTLTRTTVLASSNAGLAVNFSAGTKQVWLDNPAPAIVPRLTTGEVGLRTTPASDATITSAAPSSSATTLHVHKWDATAPSSDTSAFYGIKSILRTAAAAFTLGLMVHFSANAASAGASSTITTAKGFEAVDAIAVGANNYGYWTDFATAANKYAFYASGTAISFLGGPLQLLTAISNDRDVIVRIGNGATHPSASATVYGTNISLNAPSTATAGFFGYRSSMGTVAASFTLPSMVHFYAVAGSAGAGSTITTVRGFYAANAIAVGGTNQGFYSDINSAPNTWQLYMNGSAPSFFAGPVGIVQSDPLGGVSALLAVGSGAVNHPSSSANPRGVSSDFVTPSTATGTVANYYSITRTAATAFTVTTLVNFFAAQTIKGAGSTITGSVGFYASNNIAQGSSSYGFYSDINSNASTWQLLMDGTAESRFDGSVTIQAAGTSQLYFVGLAGTHANTGVTLYGYQSDVTSPSTNTSNLYLYRSVGRTTNASYTLNNMVHFFAENVVKGASNTLNNVRGFYAANAIAQAGTENAGFYSDIAANGSVNYQLKMAGTAPSLFGGAVIEKEITVTYSASMTIDATTGNEQVITANNGTAFTINAPTNPATGQYLEVTIRNTSGGALGAATWNAVFKMTAWTQPANGFSRTIIFRYNGTNWVEKGRTAADVPN